MPSDRRREYAIRSRPEKVGWYASEGPLLSAVPMPPEEASLADLYTNIYEDQGWHYLQIWLRVDPPNWVKVEENYPHPYLEDHVLRILDKGEPRWVTKKTYRKYVTCWRKQGYRISEGGPSGLPGSP
ncbi:hypothetical protein EVJ58_g9384 [Rhodofomes roseus]|uniref:Uncharacterized protein n=1 Tax=Rhodofomes roseus TaxID=34475 RepID=A0A4Y9XTW8_9APHY|nr:hypothetical protein EVJ58_g9384 [Rhodofomes roseus]